jgi:hypothetical protein
MIDWPLGCTLQEQHAHFLSPIFSGSKQRKRTPPSGQRYLAY